MKKLLLIAASCLMLIACKKDSTQKPITEEIKVEEKKYPIAFTFNGLDQTVTPLGKSVIKEGVGVNATAPVSDYAAKLTFVVFDANRKQVSRLMQLKSEPNVTYRVVNDALQPTISKDPFGYITDELVPGTYDIAIIASPLNVSLNRRNEGVIDTQNPKAYPELPLTNTKLWFDTDEGIAEYFVTRQKVTVGVMNAVQSITLTRGVGAIQITTQDVLPANAKFIEIGFDNEMTSLSLFDSQFSDRVPDGMVTRIDVSALAGTKNWTYRKYILNTLSPITMNFKVLDAAGKTIVYKYIPKLQILINRQTNITGNLFTGTAPINIGVSPDWDIPRNITF